GRPNGAPTPGVFALLPEGMRVVARQDTTAPGGARFTAAASPAINDSGAVVFHATVGTGDSYGVYRWQRGIITSIAPPGIREAGGVRLDQSTSPQIDRSGRIVFVGWTRQGGGFYRWADGVIRPIVLPGDRVPAKRVDPGVG